MIVSSSLRLRLLALAQVFVLAFLMAGSVQAIPIGDFLPKPVRDWVPQDWKSYIDFMSDFAISENAGKAGMVTPAMDVYAALAATPAATRRALETWLHTRMQKANLENDQVRLNGYQAYLSALQGDPGPLIAHTKQLEEIPRKRENKRKKREKKKAAESLVLHKVLADSRDRGLVEVSPQFTVNIFEDEEVRFVAYEGTVVGPQTNIPLRGTLESTRGSGHQASLFSFSLPASSRSGTYSVSLRLSDSRGLSSESVSGIFNYSSPRAWKVPPEEKKPPEDKQPPEIKKPPVTTIPPVKKSPVTPPPVVKPPATTPRPFTVAINGPSTTKVGNGTTFSPSLGGEPVEPVNYRWTIKGRTLRKHTIKGRFDSPGSRIVALVATDGAGRKVSAQLRVEVEKNDLRVQISGPGRAVAGKDITLSCQVSGGTPPYKYRWTTDGRQWKTQSMFCDYDTPGVHQAKVEVRDSKGATTQGTIQIQVEQGIAINVAGPRKVKVGESPAYTPVVVTGPKSGYSYRWESDGQVGTSLTFSPVFRTPGPKALTLTAKHPKHPAYKAERTIQVENGSPLKVRIIGPNLAETGQRVDFRPAVSGGTPPYRYTWVVKGKKISKETVGGRFEKPGKHSVVLYVSDATKSGKPSQGSLTLDVTDKEADKAPNMRVTINAPSRVKVGEGIQFSPQVRGGTPPYRYRWTVKGKTLNKKSVKGRFQKAGRQRISLSVFDSGEHSTRPIQTSTMLAVGSSPVVASSQSNIKGRLVTHLVYLTYDAGTLAESQKSSPEIRHYKLVPGGQLYRWKNGRLTKDKNMGDLWSDRNGYFTLNRYQKGRVVRRDQTGFSYKMNLNQLGSRYPQFQIHHFVWFRNGKPYVPAGGHPKSTAEFLRRHPEFR